MSIDIQNLSITLDDGRTRVADVSLRVNAGERVGLIGASGSGKSLITRAILGTLPRTMRAEGRILVEGVDILQLSELDRAAMRGTYLAAVFQNPLAALNPVRTVKQNVALPLKLHYALTRAQRRDRVLQALERVGLSPDLASRYPSELSGGQAQRVAIAEALISSPQLLLADEPTTALDALAQKHVMDLLVSLTGEQGAGLLLVSHDFTVISKATQRCYVLHDGSVVESGVTSELLAHPQEDYTKELVAAAHQIAVKGENA
ncbi:ATP-binding cassette domain-containing protein [Alloscardovia macacae]|uniref:Diguanylate cyclase n=1 Tax=Alloscardovia macacae TaxID=1160091 RepID=A0A261F638_9BIFI|nr:ABC transporter ATP-binding protein [Alloscardovia macacae]OZG54609.1 diguanylate cyclase [Alloscardovia macacae]